MKTNKLPQSLFNDQQAAGSQSQPVKQRNTLYQNRDTTQQNGRASNDANYESEDSHHLAEYLYLKNNHEPKNDYVPIDTYAAYNSPDNSGFIKTEESAMNIKSTHTPKTNTNKHGINSSYKKAADPIIETVYKNNESLKQTTGLTKQNIPDTNNFSTPAPAPDRVSEIPERIFMNGLVKHTAIALAIIIPLAVFSAYADAATPLPSTASLAVQPSAIIHKSANIPTTVDSVDLNRYAGTWYEIGRLPMYFQRNCARDVTATYTSKTDGSGITVLNQCTGADGVGIKAEGLAKPADNTGSKLKVSFLPSWIRWLPVGRADYWVLARDGDYQTALVGTPNKKYLWLLARTPNISQQTYAKYRQIAQQQGYNLKEFKLTPQTKQTVTLVP